MPEDKFSKLYSYLKENQLTDLDESTFKSKYSDINKTKEIHSYLKSQGMTDLDLTSFHSSYFGGQVKKKEATVLPSGSGEKPVQSATSVQKKQKPSESFGVKTYKGYGGTVYEGDAGKGVNKYILKDDGWYKVSYSTLPSTQPTVGVQKKQQKELLEKIDEPGRIAALNKKFKTSVKTKSDAFVGYEGKEENEYRVSTTASNEKVWEVRRKGQKEFTAISDEGSINALNKRFGADVKPTKYTEQLRESQLNRQKLSSEKVFKDVDGDLFDFGDSDVSDFLNAKYKKYGFDISTQGGARDIILVKAKNGKTEKFYTDNWSSDTDSDQARKLRTFLQENAFLGDIKDLEQKKAADASDRLAEMNFNLDPFGNIKKGVVEEQRAKQLEIFDKKVDAINKSKSKTEVDLAEEAYKKDLSELQKKDPSFSSVDDLEKRALVNSVVNYEYNTQRRIKDLQDLAKGDREKEKGVAAISEAQMNLNKSERFVYGSYIRDLNLQNKQISDRYDKALSDTEDLNKMLNNGEITQEQYDESAKQIETELDTLKSLSKDIESNNKKISLVQEQNQKNAALHKLYKETQGSVGGGLWNSFLTGLTSVLPEDLQKEIVSGLGSQMTTDEFMQSEDRWDITKAGFSVSESLGSLAASALTGGAAKAAGVGKLGIEAAEVLPFFASSYKEKMSELNDPRFKNMSDAEKVAMATIYGLGVGYLDKVSAKMGATGSIPSNIATNTIFKAISGLGKNATADAIEYAIKSQFKKDLAAGAIKIVGGAVTEGVTEGVQSLYGTGIDLTYNLINQYIKGGGEETNIPTEGWLNKAYEEAYLGALGGLIMSTAGSTVNGVKNGFSRNSPEWNEFAKSIITDSDTRAMIVTDIKSKLAQGKITKEEAKEQVDAIKNTQSILSKIPENISPEDLGTTMDLIVERSKIEKEIEGKEPALVEVQKQRISDINEQLKTISTNAVQKQTTDESVLRNEESKVGLQEMEQGNTEQEIIAKEGQKKQELESTLQRDDISPEEKTKTERELIFVNQAINHYENGGSSISQSGENLVGNEGFSVSVHPDRSNIIDGKNVSSEQIAKFKEDNSDLFENQDNFVGTWYDSSVNKTYLDVATYVKDEVEAKKMAVDANQKAIFDLKNMVEIPTGGTGEAIQKAQFTQSSKASFKDDLSKADRSKNEAATDVVKAVQKVVRSVPNAKVFIHETTEDYRRALADREGKTVDEINKDEQGVNASQGSYLSDSGEIHIDLSAADAKTVYHEAMHHVIAKSGKNVEDMARAIKKAVGRDFDVEMSKYFSEAYDTTEQSEEFLVELAARLADFDNKLSPTIVQKIINTINAISIKLIGVDVLKKGASRQEVVDFLNTISRDMARGAEISIIKSDLKDTSRKKRKAVTPDTSSNYANMTEDGQGNYVFYHRSNNLLDTIDPTKYGTNPQAITSPEEVRAWRDVGGVSMFYTDNRGEAVTQGARYNHMIKVPMDKVYDFNSDPENFSERVSGTANQKLAGVTKLANQAGYDMVVARWDNNMSRAQTTIPMYPVDHQEVVLNVVKKDFNESYESNRDLGWESEVPESKSNKVNEALMDIHNERNKNGVYDDLYRLYMEFGRYSEQDVRTLVEDSNLSDDVKKKFREAMDYKPQQSKSVRKKRKSPSVKKLMGIKDVYKLVNERVALKEKLIKENRDIKFGVKLINDLKNELLDDITSLDFKGKVSARQLKYIIKRLRSTNILNPKKRDEFFKYMERILNDSSYLDKLAIANKTKSRISKLSKGKNIQASVANMAKLFAKVNPNTVEDIDAYQAVADMVFKAVRTTRISGAELQIKEAATIETVSRYAEKEIERAEDARKAELLDEYKDLVESGAISGSMSVSEILNTIKALDETDNPATEQSEENRNSLLIRYASFASSISEMLANNEFEGMTKQIASKIIGMSQDVVDSLSNIELARLVESLDNMVTNKISDGVESSIREVVGKRRMEEISKTVKAKPLKTIFGSTKASRVYNELTASLPILFEKVLRSRDKALTLMDGMGFREVVRGASIASNMTNSVMTEYKNQFNKTKPNGKKFTDAFNVVERGMYAFLTRTVNKSETEQRAEFNRRAGLVRETIQVLSEGTKENRQRAQIYTEVANKLGLFNDNLSVEDVVVSVNEVNKSAVEFWVNKWAENYSRLADVSASVYNSILGSDINYTPDFYKMRSVYDSGIDEDSLSAGIAGGFASMYEHTSKTKSGVLMATTSPAVLPSNRYVNLEFDSTNERAFKTAMTDVETAGAIRQLSSAMKSEGFKKIFGDSKEDMEMLKRLINRYVSEKKGKSFIDPDNVAFIDKLGSAIGSLGAVKALGTITQPIKQVMPIVMNTIMNAGFNETISSISQSIGNQEFNKWLERVGEPVNLRGMDTQFAFDSVDKVDSIIQSGSDKVINTIRTVNEFWLKAFLSKPDAYIAKASFLAYYKQGLAKYGNGEKFSFDGEINEMAAQYAQQMIDRQQNVSDSDLMGQFFKSKNTYAKVFKQVVMPFSTFVMNQKNRFYSDAMQLASKNATQGDKRAAFLSMLGMTSEIATFHIVSVLLGRLWDTLAGAEDDEEEKEEKARKRREYIAVQTAQDLFSPAPFMNDLFSGAINQVIDIFGITEPTEKEIQDALDEKIIKELENNRMMSDLEQEEFKNAFIENTRYKISPSFKGDFSAYGALGIGLDKAKRFKTMLDAAKDGKYEKSFSVGNTEKTATKYIDKADKESMIVNSIMYGMYMIGALPGEFGIVSDKSFRNIDKRALSAKQVEVYEVLESILTKEELRNPKVIKAVKEGKSVDGVMEAYLTK